MKRFLAVLASAYLVLAVVGRVLEAKGMRHCGCADDCWCQQPVLSTFRWVFPYGHTLAHEPH